MPPPAGRFPVPMPGGLGVCMERVLSRRPLDSRLRGNDIGTSGMTMGNLLGRHYATTCPVNQVHNTLVYLSNGLLTTAFHKYTNAPRRRIASACLEAEYVAVFMKRCS